MNDAAYDISHLLELEAIAATPCEFRSVQPAIVTQESSAVATAEQTLAQELLQMAGPHEEMIRQYLRMKDDSLSDTRW